MFDCVIVMAGSGKRANLGFNKALLKISDQELFLYSLKTFMDIEECQKIILVCSIDDAGKVKDAIKKYSYPIEIVIGGLRRQDSVLEGVKSATSNYVLIHDAARPFVLKEDIIRLYQTLKETNKWATLAKKVNDTIKQDDKALTTLDRSNLYAISTPQAVIKDEYIEYATDCANLDLIDDMQPYEIVRKGKIGIVIQSNNNFKITDQNDIDYAKYLIEGSKSMEYRSGHGYDIHRLEKGRELKLCGIKIDYEAGLVGHSDADVALHAIMNAILGALGKGDIGEHFPDTDVKYKGIDSSKLLEIVKGILEKEGYKISNLDVSIICQRPKLLKYKEDMRESVAKFLGLDSSRVNIKANTNEGMDAIGKGLAIACLANVLIYK